MKGEQTLECGLDGTWSSGAPDCGMSQNNIKLFHEFLYLAKNKSLMKINWFTVIKFEEDENFISSLCNIIATFCKSGYFSLVNCWEDIVGSQFDEKKLLMAKWGRSWHPC